jgi:uncharacterized phage-like protein YoqJ
MLKAICGTGHRPDKMPGGWDNYIETNRGLTDLLAKHIVGFHRKYGTETIVSGLAAGWDTVLALATIEAKKSTPIKLFAAVPCFEQDSKWSNRYRNLYGQIIEQADTVKFIYEGKYKSPQCLLDRNAFMVDSTDAILAYFSGMPYGLYDASRMVLPTGRGGTLHCLRYAKEQALAGKDIKVFNYRK